MQTKETSIYWHNGDNVAEIITADYNFQKHIKSVAKKYKEVVIDAEPCKENDYYLQALIPVEFIQFKHKTKRNYNPEQRKKRSEQMKKINLSRAKGV